MALYTGGARQFYASDKTYGLAASSSAYNFATGDVFFSVWLYRDSTGNQVVLAKYEDSSNYWKLEITAGHKVQFVAVEGGVTQISVIGTTSLSSTGTWYHVCVSIDRSSAAGCKIWVNGSNDTSGTPTTSGTDIDNTGSLYIAQAGDASLFFDGRLQCVLVARPSDVTIIDSDAVASLYGERQPKQYGSITSAERTAWNVTAHYNCNEGSRTDDILDQVGSNDGVLTLANLLSNPGFEIAGGGGADVFASWAETGTISAETVAPDAGSVSCIIGNASSYVTQTVLTAGHEYSTSVRAIAASGTPSLLIYYGTANEAKATTTSWATYTDTRTAVSTGVFGLVGGTSAITIDTVSVTATGIPAANGAAAAIASDSSGAENHGVLTGFSDAELVNAWSSDVDSVPSCLGGYSLDLDGTSNYLSIADASTLRFDAGSEDFTLFCRIKTSQATRSIFDKRDGDNDGYVLGINGSGYPIFSLDTRDATGAVNLADGDWHSVAISVDRDGTMQLYADGVATGSAVSVSSEVMSTTAALLIGSDSVASTFLDGKLDDVRIYSRCLTAGEQRALDAGDSADWQWPGDPTVLWLKLNDGSIGTPVDDDPVLGWESTHSDRSQFNQATLASRPTYNYQALNGRSTLVFDGTDDHIEYPASLDTTTLGTLGIVFTTGATAFSADQTFFASADEGAANIYLQAGIDSAGKCFLEVNDSGTVHRVTGDTVLSNSADYFLSIRSDGSTWDMRVNGVTQTLTVSGSNSGKWLGDLSGRDNCTLGALVASSTSEYFEGEIAEVMLYSTRLSDTNLGELEDYVIDRYSIAMT